MDPSLVRTSKFLSLVLRHRPERIGLTLDEHGWARVDELIEAANRSGKKLTLEMMQRTVAENDKQRFSFSADGTRIRANQGHSIQVDLQLEHANPPELLFHGTVERFIASIKAQGLLKRKRQYVHLSPDKETATKVGQRRGEPVILTVSSAKMHQDGHVFYLSKNGVWLTDHVPVEYIDFPDIL